MAKQKTQTAPATGQKASEVPGTTTATVVTEFRDRNDFNKVHQVGDDVSDLPVDVLQSLFERGYVKLSNDLAADDADADKRAEARKAQLDEVLKDSPEVFKGLVLSNYEHMTFKNDADHAAFLEKVKADSASFGQVGTNQGSNTPQ